MPKPGPGKALCGAKTTKGHCGNVAGARTDHLGVGPCWRHGGTTRNHRARAKKLMAADACERLGIAIEIDPAEALLREVWECYGNVAFYRQLLNALPIHPEPRRWVEPAEGEKKGHWEGGEAGIYGPTWHVSGIATGEAKPNILLTLYNQERDRLRAVCSEAIKAGVEERRLELAEREANAIVAVLNGVLGELGLLDQPEVPAIVRKHLTLVSNG